MKPLLLNTFDANGGAAIATYRLHQGLRNIGVDSELLVQTKSTSDPHVLQAKNWHPALMQLAPNLDKFPLRFYKNYRHRPFSPAIFPEQLAGQIKAIDPDIVHLFWVTAGFLKPETLAKLNKPIVWTLHDMWAFTGGCHYDEECGRYQQNCGMCPLLGSEKAEDLSRRLWQRKLEAWKHVPITVVATSKWLANCAQASSLFSHQRIEVLPNGLDMDKYKPIDKAAARQAFNLPQDKKLILVSAFGVVDDPRKGLHFLMPALEQLSQDARGKNVELVVLGAGSSAKPANLNMHIHYINRLHDEISQVLLYSAVDVLVAPSMQENLANTVVEAMACGAPVVAFDIGGMPDMITHQKSGYLAKPFEVGDLANGISFVLNNDVLYPQLSQTARESAVNQYAVSKVAASYQNLYQDILK